MKGEIALLLLSTICGLIVSGSAVPTPTKNITKGLLPAANTIQLPCLLPHPLCSLGKQYEWVPKSAGTLPYQCNFVYGGGYKRMLYVGRVRVGWDVIPAAIHHYGQGGTETVTYIRNGQVHSQKDVEWLCGKGNVAWARVEDLSVKTLVASRAIPIGLNGKTRTLTYGCLVHSFFSDQYPASLGTVVNGHCEFEVNGEIVNSKDFDFWHTLELLVSTK